MVDLRQMREQLNELYRHVAKFEGKKNYFYCDNRRARGLVTIGIGELVDGRRFTALAARANARHWLDTRGVGIEFHHKNTNALANRQQILADWERIYNAGINRPRRNVPVHEYYRPIARYNISDHDAYRLKSTKLDLFLDTLYRRRPYVRQLDVYIQMALLDTRFQPQSVSLYDMGENPGNNFELLIPFMWNRLNPTSEYYNLEGALLMFEKIWLIHSGARWNQQRVRKRVEWFRIGVQRMLRLPDPVSLGPASPTASGYGRNMQSFNRMLPVRGGQRRRGSIGHA